ncbi:MAG: MmgE/PrpD family protein [Rhodospirillales bacterium]|nr:MmgE/PrpD family protein [Rhodospirillales bacterium]
MSVTKNLAEVALDLNFERIPGEAVEQAKLLIADTLACAIGGYDSKTGRICRETAKEISGPPEATIIGETTKVSCSAAVLANEPMIRYLDYNDDMSIALAPGDIAAAHPSDALPVAFAVGEKLGASGKDVIAAMVAGYEVIGRLLEGYATSLEVANFHHGTALPYGACAMAGRLMGLDAEQISMAMGIAGSFTVALNILDAEGEEYVMTKNLVDGCLAERGLLAAILAKKGLTGPSRIIEGNKGFAHAIFGAPDKFKLKPAGNRLWVLTTTVKGMCAEAYTHGHIRATTHLVKQYGIKPEQIESITIRTNKRTCFHTGDPVKKYPKNKETADHSSYFLTAMAVLEGAVTPRIYKDENYSDPRVIALIDRTTLEHGPEFDAIVPAAEAIITTKDGKRYRKRVEREDLKGDPRNRMNANDIRTKFVECAGEAMPVEQIDRIMDACMALDRAEKFADLMPLLVLPR